jgi:hypothetical protein
MCRKQFFLISMALVLSLAGTAPANLVGHWRFDETSGTNAADSSGNHYDGTLHGDPQWIAGYLDGALDFDGNGDYVDLSISPLLSTLGNSTFATWVNFSNEGGAWQRIFDFGSNQTFNMFLTPRTDTAGPMRFAITITSYNDEDQTTAAATLPSGWHHVAVTLDADNHTHTLYLDGAVVAQNTSARYTPRDLGVTTQNWLGRSQYGADAYFDGSLDDFRIYSRALTSGQIENLSNGMPPNFAQASNPTPKDGALYMDTWANLSWRLGDFAASHDIYFGDNFDDVNEASKDSPVFRGNQASVYFVVGFPGFPLPEGLVPGTTYYWRVDEVNDLHPESPWKGEVWSFSIPPKKAYDPIPADGAASVPTNVELRWTPGLGAKLNTIVFGDDFDTVADAPAGVPAGQGAYDPGPLKQAKIYYWRVDQFDGSALYKGDVWSFTTVGALANPNPSDGAEDITQTPILTWTASVLAASHQVYFGTDAEAVKNATTSSPEYKGDKTLGDETYDPGKLAWDTAYYWRVDEVNDTHPDSPWKGPVWSFATAGFAIVEDFESYTDDDAAGQTIWQSWIDGFGIADNGSQVGYLVPPYAEQTIVHGGSQSMPLTYNNVSGVTNSEATLTLKSARDWTEEGVVNLSLWLRGLPASVGSFVEDPPGTYTITAEGTDIWGTADEFHYAFKTLTGAGSMEAQVLSVQNSDAWAKAGVMIRETLDPGSKFAAVYVTPGNGCRFQARPETDIDATSDTDVASAGQIAITAPYWVKLERSVSGTFRGYYSSDGVNWQSMTWNPQSVLMASEVYVGLAVTSHSAGVVCEAKFSDVRTSGTVGGQWANQDIGIASNGAEPLYVAVSNAGGSAAVVAHDDPAAATIDAWNEWVVPLQTFTDKGIDLRNVDKVAIGLGSKSGIESSGGSGTVYIDDIRLYRP